MDLTNKKFTKLLVIKKSSIKKQNNILWECLCDCGKQTLVSTANLKSGRVLSCGCLKLERLLERSTTHNQRHTHLYEVWKGLRQRCYNPKNSSYHNYGERGITVCEEWNKSFEAFYQWSYSNGYSTENQDNEKLKLTIDRIDANGNYEPSNCRWVDRKTQANNLRTTKMITINGETKCISDWCKQHNIYRTTYLSRIRRGMSAEEALMKK